MIIQILFPFVEDLREYFGKYGEIESINVKTDSLTGRSRGFAFIVFKDAESIDKVVADGDHTINGKKCDPKKALARQGKIFVGGLVPELADDDIKEYFEQYGKVIVNLYKLLVILQYCHYDEILLPVLLLIEQRRYLLPLLRPLYLMMMFLLLNSKTNF